MAVYVLRSLREQHQKENVKQAAILADEFCMEARDATKTKMLFISDMLKYPIDDLQDKCLERLTTQQNQLDKWFFPTMPNEHLKPKDSCKANYELFSSMQKAPTFFKAVQYNLVMTLELDYNTRETNIFNECIDSYVKKDPKQYCLHQVVSPDYFTLWSEQAIDSECTSAATQVVLDCSDNQCDACASLIGFIFVRYSNLLEAEVNFLFKRIAKDFSKALQAKNAYNDPTKTEMVDAPKEEAKTEKLKELVPAKLQIRSKNLDDEEE